MARPQRAPPLLITTINFIKLLVQRSLDEVDNSSFHGQSLILTGLLVISVEFKECVASLELVEASVNGVAVAQFLCHSVLGFAGAAKALNVGMSARAVNKRLKEIGLIEGEPGNYVITKKGVEYGNIAFPKNSYGG